MNEFDLIRRLAKSFPTNSSVVTGAGDDCAVLDLGVPDRCFLLKTDAVVEGVHFRPDDAAARVGHKALARCLSDIAAMAGTPTAALVTLAMPRNFAVERVEQIYAGLNALAQMHDVAVVGGETTVLPERMLLSVAVLGTVPRGRWVGRTGSKPGDAIFVTGTLGGSRAGRHLDFAPRLAEGRWLASRFSIHAMIDVSDGLAGDIRHLLSAAELGAELYEPAIPLSREARLQAQQDSSTKPPLLAALTDGEDFELLFTVAAQDAVPLLDQWKAEFPSVPLTCIGRIQSEPGVIIRGKDGVRPLNVHGYLHFS